VPASHPIGTDADLLFRIFILDSESWVACLPRDHRLAGRDQVSVNELLDAPSSARRPPQAPGATTDWPWTSSFMIGRHGRGERGEGAALAVPVVAHDQAPTVHQHLDTACS
jgi:hypothetical protein